MTPSLSGRSSPDVWGKMSEKKKGRKDIYPFQSSKKTGEKKEACPLPTSSSPEKKKETVSASFSGREGKTQVRRTEVPGGTERVCSPRPRKKKRVRQETQRIFYEESEKKQGRKENICSGKRERTLGSTYSDIFNIY